MFKKAGNLILITAVAFVLLVMLMAAFWFKTANDHEKDTKNLLSSEIQNLPVPSGCSEKSRVYQTGGIDASSAWFVNYTCDTTGQTAYEYLISALGTKGYTEQQDNFKSSPNGYYDFTYASAKYVAHYNFVGINARTYPPQDKPTLEKAPVKTINLELTRN